MKKITLFLALTFVVSCNQPSPKQQSPEVISNESVKEAVKSEDTLQSIINENIHKTPLIDTIFLGFTFGMTKNEVMRHFNHLVSQKKFFFNDQDQHYEYPLALELTKANASVAPEYKNNKLYKLTLIITPADNVTTEDMIYQGTALLYMKKYTGFEIFKEHDLINTNDDQHHWIKNNLHIYQHKTVEGTIVSYINMPAEQLIEKEGKSDADSAKSRTQKDI